MLTYVGKGYSSAFTASVDAIMARLNRGEDILIVEGPDDLCAPLLGEETSHCFSGRIGERDRLAALAAAAVLSCSVKPGLRLGLNQDLLRRLRQAFRSGEIRQPCCNCKWSSLCNSIADADFEDVRLMIPG